MGLRVRTLELRSRLSAFMSKNAEVVRLDPDPQQDSVISNKAELILERLERLSALIKSRSTNLSEDELDEIELSLRECEGEMIPLEQKVDRILGKI
ncbi:hypothetical protein MAALD49_38500 [Marinobacter shengliensis]|nr:hypothetical protein MAALD49_38500 [Marinobacter shengliensis]